MRVVLLGPPGAGKGTQAKSLEKNLGVPHVSSGDLLRAAVEKSTELGLAAKCYMDAGELVPDALVLDMIDARISQPDCDDGFLLDGFPRTEQQASRLTEMLVSQGGPLEHVVSLTVGRSEVVERLAGRRSCPDCGRLYHLKFEPPRVQGLCDTCGKDLVVRGDDRDDTARQRVEVYERQTAPLIEFYRQQALLREVDGTGRPAEVTGRILTVVGATQ